MANNQKSSSVEIMKKLELMEKRIEELENYIKITNNEILSTVNEINVKISQGNSTRSRATSAKNSSASASTPTEKKPPNTPVIWFRYYWAKNREEAKEKYCTKEIIKALDKYMETDSTAKTKAGAARLDMEAKFIWHKYVKPSECEELRNRIKADYEAYVENFNKNNMTPVSKDSNKSDEE